MLPRGIELFFFIKRPPFSVIETMLLEAMTPVLVNKPQDIYLNAQIEELIKIRKALPEIDAIIKRLNLSTISKQSLSESQIRARFYLNILEAEEKLFREHKKTFRPLLHVYGSNIQELGSNPQELWKFIMVKMSEWPLERSYR